MIYRKTIHVVSTWRWFDQKRPNVLFEMPVFEGLLNSMRMSMTSSICVEFGENPSHSTINTCNKYYHHHHHQCHQSSSICCLYWFLAWTVKFCQQIICHRPLNDLSIRQMPFVISALNAIWTNSQYSIFRHGSLLIAKNMHCYQFAFKKKSMTKHPWMKCQTEYTMNAQYHWANLWMNTLHYEVANFSELSSKKWV